MTPILENKTFEIFSGTGGVGKTTMATARAIHLAKKGSKVLLITIDPSKRLKDLLGLSNDQAGAPILVEDPLRDGSKLSLHVELMDPSATFSRIAKKNNCPEVIGNRILNILTRPYGGLNEILSIVELNDQYASENFDIIILDTPPGGHFLDFLDGIERIKVFFDQSFIEIFKYLGKKVDIKPVNFGKRIFTIVVSKGIKKLLTYLQRVTGETFVDEFIDAVIAIYKTKDSFLDALKLQVTLKAAEKSNWFLVTSVEQSKVREALELKTNVNDMVANNSYVILNKSLQTKLQEWQPLAEEELKLKESLVKKEESIRKNLAQNFKEILGFTEIFSNKPEDHIIELTKQWNFQKI